MCSTFLPPIPTKSLTVDDIPTLIGLLARCECIARLDRDLGADPIGARRPQLEQAAPYNIRYNKRHSS